MKKIIIATILLATSSVFAGECKISITRKACAGKEAEAFKPYNGKETTEEVKSQDSIEKCSAFAEKSAKIVRKGTLTQKIVKGTFDGKDLGKEFSDKAECK